MALCSLILGYHCLEKPVAYLEDVAADVQNIGTVCQTTQWSHPRKPHSSFYSWGQIFLHKGTSFDLLLKMPM
jgi:hypothetical protein